MKQIFVTQEIAHEIEEGVARGVTGHPMELSKKAKKVWAAMVKCKFKCELVVKGEPQRHD